VLGVAVGGCKVLGVAVDGCKVLGVAVDALNETETAACESGLYPCLWSPGTHRTRRCLGPSLGPSFGPHALKKKAFCFARNQPPILLPANNSLPTTRTELRRLPHEM
jgi:hypothetical protein